jgi:hypothetical protein
MQDFHCVSRFTSLVFCGILVRLPKTERGSCGQTLSPQGQQLDAAWKHLAAPPFLQTRTLLKFRHSLQALAPLELQATLLGFIDSLIEKKLYSDCLNSPIRIQHQRCMKQMELSAQGCKLTGVAWASSCQAPLSLLFPDDGI